MPHKHDESHPEQFDSPEKRQAAQAAFDVSEEVSRQMRERNPAIAEPTNPVSEAYLRNLQADREENQK